MIDIDNVKYKWKEIDTLKALLKWCYECLIICGYWDSVRQTPEGQKLEAIMKAQGIMNEEE